MRIQFLVLGILLSFISLSARELTNGDLSEKSSSSFFLKELNKRQKEKILSGDVYISSNMDTLKSNPPQQALDYFAAGKHKKSCRKALIKMSSYENYSSYIDFIKESSYNDETQELNFLFEHTLLPFPIRLKFKIERILGEGKYQYFFDTGFLKGLKGNIKVDQIKEDKRCLFQIDAKWIGPDTGIGDTIFEIFTTTLGKVGIKKIYRISEI